MNIYIALLKGINVGGKHKILMADLKILFKELGFESIQTYIQSGNVFFKSNEKQKKILANLITAKIRQVYNYDIAVIIKTIPEIDFIYNNNPFILKDNNIDTKKLYITYLNESPKSIDQLLAVNFGEDEFIIQKNIIFIKYSIGAGKTKLTNSIIEKKLDVIATSRNWCTTKKLTEISFKLLKKD